MTIESILAAIEGAGATVRANGDDLVFGHQPNAIGEELWALIRERKAEIVRLLRSQQPPIFVDLETRSAAKLKQVSGRRYALHPSTEILSLVALADQRVHVWLPSMAAAMPTDPWPKDFDPALPVEIYLGPTFPAPVAAAIAEGRPLCAHNAEDFDRPVWEAKGLPAPSKWVDTLPMVRAAGMPGKLDGLGRRLLGRGKDEEGQRALKSLWAPNRQGHFLPLTAQSAQDIVRYNIADVLLLQQVYARFAGCEEKKVIALDQRINARGIEFDRMMAQSLINLDRLLSQAAVERAAKATKGAITERSLASHIQLKRQIAKYGINLPNTERKVVEQALKKKGLHPAARAILEARLAVSRTGTAKLQQGLDDNDPDGRLRHLFRYHGTATGRWAGRRFQPHNLPRPDARLVDLTPLIATVNDLSAFKKALPKGVSPQDGISALIRPTLRATNGNTLLIMDFASVEARGVAWCAREKQLLKRFADGDDVYSAFASRLFGRKISKADESERAVGKMAILGCGYQMGGERFNEQCQNAGVDLDAVGLNATTVIDGYRRAFPAIAGTPHQGQHCTYFRGGLWRDLQAAVQETIEHGERHEAGRCCFEMAGKALEVALPSGRKMSYQEAHVRMEDASERFGGSPHFKPEIHYTDPKDRDETLYGGRITENIVSGICRDLLVAAMFRLEEADLPIVLHVHDEIVLEVEKKRAPAALNQAVQIMSEVPAWARGFPIEVSGFAAERYFKSPPPRAPQARARDGRLV